MRVEAIEKQSIQAEIDFVLETIKKQYASIEQESPRKGSYQMGSRIGKMNVLGEMKCRLEGILERYPEAKNQ